MKPYRLSVRAGVEEQYSVGPANVIFLDPDATYRVTVKAPENGEEFTLSPGGVVRLSPFEELRISHDSSSDQIVPLFVGYDTDAKTAQVSGNMEIIGGSSNAANPPIVQRIVDPVLIESDLTGLSYSGKDWTADGTLQTIVAPSANVNGVRLHRFSATSSGGLIRLMASAAAPASWSDPAAKTISVAYNSVTPVALSASNDGNWPVTIPPSEGVYVQASGGSSSWFYGLFFEVL